MTNRHNNWERILKVLDMSGMSINLFASHLGLSRAESLYHIRKGDYGISQDLADRIIACYPNIDRTWLLSGVGNMFKSDTVERNTVPFYKEEAEITLLNINGYTPNSDYSVPFQTGAELVLRSHSLAMSDALSVAHDLFLRSCTVEEIIQGNEYVIIVGDEVIWRRVRLVARDNDKLRLVAQNREDFPDIFVNRSDIKKAWRVIARLAILES